jgi:hypothetical protein
LKFICSRFQVLMTGESHGKWQVPPTAEHSRDGEDAKELFYIGLDEQLAAVPSASIAHHAAQFGTAPLFRHTRPRSCGRHSEQQYVVS